jgi:hypothetical protein
MNNKEGILNATVRRDARFPQFSELSMNYEGYTDDIAVRPPDLSPHGMFVNTARELAEGAVLKLRFRLFKSGIVIETRCEVRYCLKGVGVGVEFVGISPEAAQAIEEEVGVMAVQK